MSTNLDDWRQLACSDNVEEMFKQKVLLLPGHCCSGITRDGAVIYPKTVLKKGSRPFTHALPAYHSQQHPSFFFLTLYVNLISGHHVWRINVQRRGLPVIPRPTRSTHPASALYQGAIRRARRSYRQLYSPFFQAQ